MSQLVSLEEEPGRQSAFSAIGREAWPEFIAHEPTGMRLLPWLSEAWPGFQLVLVDRVRGTPVACCRTVPFAWSGELAALPSGWSGLLEQAFEDWSDGRSPTALGGISAFALLSHRGRKLGTQLVAGMRDLAIRAGLYHVVAPVRPTW